MKKILAICLVMVMVLSVSVTAFAAPGRFVSSPSGNPAPIVISFDPESDDCTAELVITPYAERDTLSAEDKEMIEKAYDSIADSKDLTQLNEDLDALARERGIAAGRLAVSDLFDAHLINCDEHDDHFNFDIVLEADTLERFVALLYMNESGEWVMIDNASVTNDGKYLEFTTDYFSPFAIVVDTDGYNPPKTGDNSRTYIYVSLMAVSALLFAAVLIKDKKQKEV